MTREKLRLGNYEPLLELAAGGMATVYVARQLGAAGFERLVVIKRVHRHHLGNRDFYRMFLDEARVASLVRHPNVVPVIDTVEQEGELFLVMEYVESTALSTLLRTTAQEGDRLPPGVAARIIADTLAGLHAAHEATDMRGQRLEIVHRDVSPQNIVVGIDGTSRLIDFGVAKAAHRLSETRSGSLKGKLAYMSPEQAMGRDVDRRVDIFAAGVALHEALTGRRLFQGENDFDTMRRITEMPVPDPSSIAPGVSRALDYVVQHALVRNPEGRFQTAAQFLDALEAAIPLAPPREVGAYLQMKCTDRLEDRRTRLKAVLEGQAEPLSMRLMPDASDPSNDSTLASPAAMRRRALGAGETESQISQIAASIRDANVAPPSKGRVWLGLGAVALALSLSVGGLWAAQRAIATRRAATRAAAIAEAAAPPPAPPKADEVDVTVVTVRADTPILGARAPGAKRVEIVGDHATLYVTPWSGVLVVDAVLEGGKPARASVEAGTTEAVTLVPASPPPSAARPSRVGTAGKSGAQKKNELQDNPY
jgi:eukaryotic-like serine/threonine-protein kinase